MLARSARKATRSIVGATTVVVGIVVGTSLCVACTGSTGRSASPTTVDVNGGPSEQSFLDAYRRSLEASYAMEGEFTRTMSDGRTLQSGLLVAQRPPDRIRRQLGGVSGEIDGFTLNCSTTPEGELSCAQGVPAPSYREDVEQRVATLASYFDPNSPPLYQVWRNGPGCFRLDLLRAVPDPVYGDFTIMCFDDAIGAMTRFELHRGDGSIDLVEAVTVRPVSDLDFVVSRDPSFDQHNNDLQGAWSTTTEVTVTTGEPAVTSQPNPPR